MVVIGESLRMSYRRHMREEALRATQTLITEKGWNKVRFSDVAAMIGVSRPTLYKEFASKSELGDALVLRETERFLTGIQTILDTNTDSVPRAITEAVQYTLDEAVESPLLRAALTAPLDDLRGESSVLRLVATSTSMLELATQRLISWFDEHLPNHDRADIDHAVDVLIRLTVSHIVLPAADGNVHRENVETCRQISDVVLRFLRL